MRNAGLDEIQAGIKIAGRNVNNLRYADDIILMAESEELKSLLMKVKKEPVNVGLKLTFQKMKIMASGPISSWQIDGVTVEKVADFILEVSKSIENCVEDAYSLEGKLGNLDSIFKSRDIVFTPLYILASFVKDKVSICVWIYL